MSVTQTAVSALSQTAVSALSVASSSADALISGRVVAGTKKAYQSTMQRIQTWYTQNNLDFRLPVKRDEIKSFFGALTDTDPPLSVSTVKGYKSALVWYYKEHGMVLDPETNQQLQTLMKGYKRKVATLKLDGKMAVFEGKHHLSFQAYCVLAKHLLSSSDFNQMLFAWPYLLLQWNLIARTNTIACMMMEHIGWEGDALLISTPKHKGDQEGANCFSRHVYANPSNPAICPILSLAILMFVRSIRHDHSSASTENSVPNFRVFDGSDSTARYSDTLLRVIATAAMQID